MRRTFHRKEPPTRSPACRKPAATRAPVAQATRVFTITEMLATVSVMVILISVAAGSFNATISNNRAYGAQIELRPPRHGAREDGGDAPRRACRDHGESAGVGQRVRRRLDCLGRHQRLRNARGRSHRVSHARAMPSNVTITSGGASSLRFGTMGFRASRELLGIGVPLASAGAGNGFVVSERRAEWHGRRRAFAVVLHVVITDARRPRASADGFFPVARVGARRVDRLPRLRGSAGQRARRIEQRAPAQQGDLTYQMTDRMRAHLANGAAPTTRSPAIRTGRAPDINSARIAVHTNICILNCSFGIRQMTQSGFHVVRVRTDGFDDDTRTRPFVSHSRYRGHPAHRDQLLSD